VAAWQRVTTATPALHTPWQQQQQRQQQQQQQQKQKHSLDILVVLLATGTVHASATHWH
jgi:hypothetical protein